MSHANRLLIATPLIGDPNFERTVIFVLAHADEGAFGLVLNRPCDSTVAESIEDWAPLATEPAVLFIGGPVDRTTIIGLARSGPVPPSHGWAGLFDAIGTVDLSEPPAADADLAGLRLFAGSAGWSPGQLEDEISEGAWWVVDAAPDDILTADPERLWESVVRRQGGQTAWFANHPLDPSMN